MQIPPGKEVQTVYLNAPTGERIATFVEDDKLTYWWLSPKADGAANFTRQLSPLDVLAVLALRKEEHA